MGEWKTLARITPHFYWPNMRNTVHEYVKTCESCQRNKASTQLPQGLLQALEIPDTRWQTVTMDFITGLPITEKRYDSVLVVVDKFSKLVHYIPTHKEVTAPEVAQLFLDNIVKHHGLPRSIVSDRDSKFTSKFWNSLCGTLGIQTKMSTSRHPQTDGQTERANRVLEDTLRHYVSKHQSDWDKHLTAAQIAVNSSVQASTAFTPYYLNYGYEPNFNFNLGVASIQNDAAAQLLQQLQRNLETARKNMINARDKQTHYANKYRRDFSFKEGEEVLLSTQHLSLPQGISKKLSARYTGPFKILQAVGPAAYKLAIPEEWTRNRVHPVFHVSLLKKYNTKSSEFSRRPEQGQDIVEIEADEKEYEVDRIIGQRITKDKQVQYLVTWKGYDDSEATWESADNVNDLEAMDQFEKVLQQESVTLDKRHRMDIIMRKWTKPQVQNYIMSLVSPPKLRVSSSQIAAVLKRHQVDGEKLIRLSKPVVMDMDENVMTPQVAEWLIQQLEHLYSSESTYPL
jgi:transposase InsO family protein